MTFFRPALSFKPNMTSTHRLKQFEVFVFKTSNLDLAIRFGKVHIFWEDHKILRNLHLTFVCKVEILKHFVVFSEYMNFKWKFNLEIF